MTPSFSKFWHTQIDLSISTMCLLMALQNDLNQDKTRLNASADLPGALVMFIEM